MDNCIESLGDATIFSSLDANRGYWNVGGCQTRSRKERFRVLPRTILFYSGAIQPQIGPGTYQRATVIILSLVIWQVALICLNDIIILSKSPGEHMDQYDNSCHTDPCVRLLLNDAGVALKLNPLSPSLIPSTTWPCHQVRRPGS